MGRIPLYDENGPLKPSSEGRELSGPKNEKFDSCSILNFSQLKEKGKLYFRQALLEIILGEAQASWLFSAGQSRKDKTLVVEEYEQKLRETLQWGDLYLKAKNLVTVIQQHTISFSSGEKEDTLFLGIDTPLQKSTFAQPSKDKVLSEPDVYIVGQKQYFEASIEAPFKEWTARNEHLEFPLSSPFSDKPLNSLIPASVALFTVIQRPDFPETWPMVVESENEIHNASVGQRELGVELSSEVEAPSRGIGNKDWELYCYCETPKRLDEIRKKMGYSKNSKAHTAAISRLNDKGYFVKYNHHTKLYQIQK